MKTRIYPSLGLVALCAAGFGTKAVAGIFSDNFEMLVIAEQMQAPASQDTPTPLIAIDGGYVEAGDPIAGDNPPSPDQISQALQSALANNGFRASPGTPAVVVTYHWGVLRVDHRQIKTPYGIKSNLMARIELVSTEQLGAEVENHILGREKGGGMNEDASAPRLLVGPLETIRQDSRQPRIFVVVSAYDYQGLIHREAKLVWRTKLSALETSGSMDTVIPALIAAGGPYFGKNFSSMKEIEVTPSKTAPAASENANFRPSPESYQLDKQFIDGLLKQEHAKVSGEN